jgi:hypothetical protein
MDLSLKRRLDGNPEPLAAVQGLSRALSHSTALEAFVAASSVTTS